jgi:hypothetical protein
MYLSASRPRRLAGGGPLERRVRRRSRRAACGCDARNRPARDGSAFFRGEPLLPSLLWPERADGDTTHETDSSRTQTSGRVFARHRRTGVDSERMTIREAAMLELTLNLGRFLGPTRSLP